MINQSLCMALALLLLLAEAYGSSSSPPAEISCSDVVTALIPCGAYLMGDDASEQPSPECCQGAQWLIRTATTDESHRQLCECLKETGPSFGVKPDRARQLPPSCKISLNISISPDFDCNRRV